METQKYYSKSTNGFFSSEIHMVMPPDAVAITDELWTALLDAQGEGMVITTGAAGLPIAVAPPPPTVAQVIASLSVAVQAFVDAAAQSLGYDNILSAISYADDATVPSFQAQGQALRAWRANVWKDANAALNAINANTVAPTAAALIATLPVFVPPTV